MRELSSKYKHYLFVFWNTRNKDTLIKLLLTSFIASNLTIFLSVSVINSFNIKEYAVLVQCHIFRLGSIDSHFEVILDKA